MEREGFINNSKMAVKGVLNGILGMYLYELIISLFVSFVVAYVVSVNNPSASGEQLQGIVDNVFASFPFAILISCLVNVVILVVFVLIIKFDKFKEICKKAFNSKAIKYGCLTALCVMGFSIVYNFFVVLIFDLDSVGNANQEIVVSMISSQPFLGFLSVVILAPIVEELTFRFCMFGGLYNRNKKLAYIVSGVIFMFMHSIASFSSASGFNKEFLIELIYLPPYLFSGLALCYCYDKTDNIGTSFIAHALNNLISFLSIICL